MIFLGKAKHFNDYNELSAAASEFVAKKVEGAKGQFSIAFPGGSSVKGMLQILGEQKPSWPHVNAVMADERLVSKNDPQSNFSQANKLFFSKAKAIHVHPFEKGDSLADYNKKFFSVTRGKLDLAILGVGEDGHIASLFPGAEALQDASEGFIEIKNAPKMPRERISLSPKSIAQSKDVLLLFASESKRSAYNNFCDKSVSQNDCPAKIVLGAKSVSIMTVFGDLNAQ
ncbi:MAG: 6-phosphogluconolactonase [archaeon]|nr:6-phosphogluconolactonase [archaeon]